MPLQLTQLTPCNASSFYQPCFKGYWNTCLTHLLLTCFINSSSSQIGATPTSQNYLMLFTLSELSLNFLTAYSPNYLVLIIYLSSFIFQLHKNIYSSPIHLMSICGAPTTSDDSVLTIRNLLKLERYPHSCGASVLFSDTIRTKINKFREG